jgi:hypothetical protein
MKGSAQLQHRQYVSEGTMLSGYDSHWRSKGAIGPGRTRDDDEREDQEETYIHVYGISCDKVNRQIERRTPCHAYELKRQIHDLEVHIVPQTSSATTYNHGLNLSSLSSYSPVNRTTLLLYPNSLVPTSSRSLSVDLASWSTTSSSYSLGSLFDGRVSGKGSRATYPSAYRSRRMTK